MKPENSKIDPFKIVDDFQRWDESFPDFLFDCVYTIDEASQKVKSIEHKEYLEYCANLIQSEKLLVFEKSRRMLASWMGAAYILWKPLFRPFTACHWQGKKREESNKVLQNRIFPIYKRLPVGYPWPGITTNNKDLPIENNFEIIHDAEKQEKSNIYAIAEGADQLRSETSSLLIIDEFAFQDRQIEALAAFGPTVQGGGQIIIISTIKPGTGYEMLVKDEF
ncbi:MAG: hypothetical protein U9P90_02095 [Patescibacteria group bacterium]|nr:hypothetical protein [Patescibacteria group bacterium]